MDDTRALVDSWDDLPSAFPYSEKFITTFEAFKITKCELFQNFGLSIAAVGVIVFFIIASPVTALLVTLNVACCLIGILGFMHAFGIVIDSVSVINIVLVVGLSVDYSAREAHCFMVKPGDNKNERALEALADIGAAVLSGAISTFFAVVVLLFFSSCVFGVSSKQFALTVALGVTHGLILVLPVLLSLFGPKPFSSAEKPGDGADKPMAVTSHSPEDEGSSEGQKQKAEIDDKQKEDVDEA
jgi:Niemann-Pick C1 protein